MTTIAKTTNPQKLSKAEKREHLHTFASLVANDSPSESLAMAHFKKHPWIAYERFHKDKTQVWNADFGGGWPLHMAVAYHCEELVEMMIASGAPINVVSKEGDNALMFATGSYDNGKTDPTAMVNLLLRHGCRADSVNFVGYGVLYTIYNDLPSPLFRQLLDAGARVNCYHTDGYHFLAEFIRVTRNEENALALMETKRGLDIDGCQGRGAGVENALDAALRLGFFGLADRLVELGADVRRLNNLGCSLLHFARSQQMVDWLLDRAPDLLNQPNHLGDTPVLTLAKRLHSTKREPGFLSALTQLVNAGADLDYVGYSSVGRASARYFLQINPDSDVKAVWSSLTAREVAREVIADLNVQTTTNQSTKDHVP